MRTYSMIGQIAVVSMLLGACSERWSSVERGVGSSGSGGGGGSGSADAGTGTGSGDAGTAPADAKIDAPTGCWGTNALGQNTSQLVFSGTCWNADDSGCGGWGPGDCEDCSPDVACIGCTPSCCTIEAMSACDDLGDGESCDCAGCGPGGGSGSAQAAVVATAVAAGEELAYFAQVVSRVLADGSIELRGSLLLQGARSYSVVGQPVIVTIAANSSTGMARDARVAAALSNVMNQLEARYAVQVAGATTNGFTCRALQWAGRNLPRLSLLASVFLLFQVSAAAGEYLPRVVIPNTVRVLGGEGGLRSRCTSFATWYQNLYTGNQQPMATGVNCGTCYDRSIGAAPVCAGLLDQCTTCSQSGTNPNAMYQDLRRGVDNHKWEFALSCATRAGGYFTQANGGEAGLQAAVAAGYTRAAVCPY